MGEFDTEEIPAARRAHEPRGIGAVTNANLRSKIGLLYVQLVIAKFNDRPWIKFKRDAPVGTLQLKRGESVVFTLAVGGLIKSSKIPVMKMKIEPFFMESSHSEEGVKALEQLKTECKDLLTSKLEHCKEIPVELKLKDNKPVVYVPYPLQEQGIVEKFHKSVRKSVIFASHENPGWYRITCDHRKINKKLYVDSYSVPVMEMVLQHLQKAKYLTILDLNPAFLQGELHPNSRAPLVFCSPWGLYQWTRLPMGVNSGPRCMSRVLTHVLGKYLYEFVFTYIDDVCIYSNALEEHLEHLRLALDASRKAGLAVNPEKIKLGTTTRALFGIYHFRGEFANRSGKGENQSALNKLKKVPFQWNEDQENAFQKLKDILANPAWHLPNFSEEFFLHCGASSVATGAKLLTQAEHKLTIYEKECFSCIWGMEKSADYLDHAPFAWYTDNQAPAGRLARWLVRLARFKFNVQQIRGVDNSVADALPRMHFAEEFEQGDGQVKNWAPAESVASVDSQMSRPVVGNTGVSEVNRLRKFPKQHENADRECKQIFSGIKSGTSPYVVHEGFLGEWMGRGFCACKLEAMVFKYYQESYYGGYLGRDETICRALVCGYSSHVALGTCVFRCHGSIAPKYLGLCLCPSRFGLTAPYHPQAHLVERVNRNTKIAERSFQPDTQRHWDDALYLLKRQLRCFRGGDWCTPYKDVTIYPGDLILVEPHHLSSKMDYFIAKLAVKRRGPFQIVKFLSPMTGLIEDPYSPTKYEKLTFAATGGGGVCLTDHHASRPPGGPAALQVSELGLSSPPHAQHLDHVAPASQPRATSAHFRDSRMSTEKKGVGGGDAPLEMLSPRERKYLCGSLTIEVSRADGSEVTWERDRAGMRWRRETGDPREKTRRPNGFVHARFPRAKKKPGVNPRLESSLVSLVGSIFQLGSAASLWSTTVVPVGGEGTLFSEPLRNCGTKGHALVSHVADNALDTADELLFHYLQLRRTLGSCLCVPQTCTRPCYSETQRRGNGARGRVDVACHQVIGLKQCTAYPVAYQHRRIRDIALSLSGNNNEVLTCAWSPQADAERNSCITPDTTSRSGLPCKPQGPPSQRLTPTSTGLSTIPGLFESLQLCPAFHIRQAYADLRNCLPAQTTGTPVDNTAKWVWSFAGTNGRGETGDPREKPLSRGIVGRNSRVPKSGSDHAGNRTRFAWRASSLASRPTPLQPPTTVKDIRAAGGRLCTASVTYGDLGSSPCADRTGRRQRTSPLAGVFSSGSSRIPLPLHPIATSSQGLMPDALQGMTGSCRWVFPYTAALASHRHFIPGSDA
ncbi:hypothetical protein PR048_029368 [Dryococelus australis]|uniref:Reverse transcriptase domain-containing protein n=1 Tax=Dryococelus australis TaxID=614101 RepID=A0ABQ9GDT7_9NEOP|nr:hypothetical protein PR048_029368 [Dryococelus australis]